MITNILNQITECINFITTNDINYLFFVFIFFIMIVFSSALVYIFKIYIQRKIEYIFLQKLKHTNKQLLHYVQKNQIIQNLLQKISLYLKADVVYLMQFHNGCNSMSGLPFIYQSCTHWFSNITYGHFFIKMQNLLVSLFPKFIKQLLSVGDIYISNIDQWQQNSMKQFLSEQKFKSLIFLVLHDQLGNIIGYITIGLNRQKILTPAQQLFIHQIKNNIKFQIKKMGKKQEIYITTQSIKKK